MSNILYGDDGLQSIRLIFVALITVGFLKDTQPEKFKDIPTVDVYQDDWKAQLKDQDEAWIISPIHYFPGGKRIHRKASGGGTWNNRDQKEKNYEQAPCYVRKFKFVESTNEQQATNDGTRLQNYTMIEYLPKEPKPQYALCRLTVDNKKSAHDKPPSISHPQPKIMEIDNTDANKGDKGETSQLHGPLQRGGNFENATRNYNQLNLEIFFAQIIQGGELSEFMKYFPKDYIVQVFSLMMDQIPAASPKEQSTKAAVRDPRKRGSCTFFFSRKHGRRTSTNAMEEDTSTQRQEQAKVEILGLNAAKEEPEFVNSPSSLNQNNGGQSIQLSNNSGHKQTFESNSSREKGEQSSHDSKYIGTSTGSGATFGQWDPDRPEKDTLEGLGWPCNTHDDASWFNSQMFESNSYLEKPTNLRRDTNGHSSDFGVQSSHHGNYNEKNAEQGTNIRNFATIHDPHTVEEPLSLCNFGDMVEPTAAPQEPNQLSPNFNESSTEPMDNQNRNAPNPSTSIFTTQGRLDHQVQVQAPGPNTSNPSTIVPRNIDSNNIFEDLTDLSSEELHVNRCYERDAPIWAWDENNILDYFKNLAEPIANGQEPNQLSHNFNANSTVAMDYQNSIEPYPSTSNFETTEGRLDHQMFESDADVLELNNSSYYFEMISTEPTEKGNHLPMNNQNTIAPGLNTNNNATTEPEDMDWINIMDFSD